MVSENLSDLLKSALRKSYQSQKIKFNELQASYFISASFNSLYYSLTLILSQKLYHAICFNGCALATCSARLPCLKRNSSVHRFACSVFQHEEMLK